MTNETKRSAAMDQLPKDFPGHVMISDRTRKPATYAVLETERKPRLRVVK